MNKMLMAVAVAGVLAVTTGCEWTAGSGTSTWNDSAVATDFSGMYVAQGNYVVTEPGSAVSNSVTDERMTYGDGANSYAGTLAHAPAPGTLVVRAGNIVLYDNGSGKLVALTNGAQTASTTTNSFTETLGYIKTGGSTGGVQNVTETIAIGDGSKTAFAGTFSKIPDDNTLTITVGGYIFRDLSGTNATGSINLTCNINDGSIGTLNRITGDWTLTFPAPISAGTTFTATYIAGGGGVSGNSYSGSASHSPIMEGTFTLTCGDYTFLDDGWLGSVGSTVELHMTGHPDNENDYFYGSSSASINRDTGFWTMTIRSPPAAGSPIVASYRYTESQDPSTETASGTINYASGTWTLTFGTALSGSDKVLADYMYVTGLQQGNHGNGIFSLTVTPMGTNLRITDNNGSVYTGTMGANSTTTDREFQFSVTGVSQGYKVTIVGTLSLSGTTRMIHGTYIEENGYTAELHARAE